MFVCFGWCFVGLDCVFLGVFFCCLYLLFLLELREKAWGCFWWLAFIWFFQWFPCFFSFFSPFLFLVVLFELFVFLPFPFQSPSP